MVIISLFAIITSLFAMKLGVIESWIFYLVLSIPLLYVFISILGVDNNLTVVIIGVLVIIGMILEYKIRLKID